MKAEFQIGDMLTIGMIFVVTAIGLAFGLNVLSDVKGDFTVNSVEANATGDAIEGVAKFTSKFGILATIVVAAIIIGVLYNYFMRVRD